MARISVLLLIQFQFIINISSQCLQKSACLCELSEFSKIDLTELLTKTEQGAPQFLTDSDGNRTYSFHGCTDGEFKLKYNETTVLKTLKASILWSNRTDADIIGTSTNIKFSPDNGGYQIIYTNGSTVFASVRLVCDNFDVPFLKVLDAESKRFAVSSPHACIITHHPGMSTGSVLVIIFLIVAALYFIGGAVLLYFIRGARGLEMIPNIDFWRSIPGLVRDGLIFLFNGCSATTINLPDSYDRI